MIRDFERAIEAYSAERGGNDDGAAAAALASERRVHGETRRALQLALQRAADAERAAKQLQHQGGAGSADAVEQSYVREIEALRAKNIDLQRQVSGAEQFAEESLNQAESREQR